MWRVVLKVNGEKVVDTCSREIETGDVVAEYVAAYGEESVEVVSVEEVR